MLDKVDLAKLLKEYRKKNKLTQLEVAEKLGKTQATIQRYENGKIEIPLSILNKYECLFGLRLVEGDKESNIKLMIEKIDNLHLNNKWFLTYKKEIELLIGLLRFFNYKIYTSNPFFIGVQMNYSTKLITNQDFANISKELFYLILDYIVRYLEQFDYDKVEYICFNMNYKKIITTSYYNYFENMEKEVNFFISLCSVYNFKINTDFNTFVKVYNGLEIKEINPEYFINLARESTNSISLYLNNVIASYNY